MKNKVVTIAALLFLVGMSSFASAYTIGFDYDVDVNCDYTSNYAGAVVETFDNGTPLLWSWSASGSYNIVTGTGSGYAAPAGDTTYYVTVPSNLEGSSGSVDVALGATYNYFGLFWGSVDAYNTLSFLDGTDVVASFGGSQIASPANGDRVSDLTNLYVNLYDLPDFDSFRMSSTSRAFEADNIAVGPAPVPEPATLLLLGSGLAGLAFYRRKRR